MIISDLSKLPFGYAVVRYKIWREPADPAVDSYTLYSGYEVLPIPLHWLKRWYIAIRKYNHTADETILLRWRDRSFREGYDQGVMESNSAWEKKLAKEVAKAKDEFILSVIKTGILK